MSRAAALTSKAASGLATGAQKSLTRRLSQKRLTPAEPYCATQSVIPDARTCARQAIRPIFLA
jgi:hypothetical protein